MGNQLSWLFSSPDDHVAINRMDLALTIRENSIFGSYDDVYTTKYFCNEEKCDFETAKQDIGDKYPSYIPIIEQIDEFQVKIYASRVKNIILHNEYGHIAVLKNDNGEHHELNAFININAFE